MSPFLIRRQQTEDGASPHDPSSPPTPHSYWFPLSLIVLACAGYIYWRRRRRYDGDFSLKSLAKLPSPSGVRLSMEDDGPASHSFVTNNASTDSLPTHALEDIPVIDNPPQDPSPVHPAHQVSSSPPLGSVFPQARLTKSSGGGGGGRGRRSARNRGPIELDDSDSSLSGEGARHATFGIGDEEEEEEEVAREHPLAL
ncbi:hypothetical protein M231_05090 [Tremella mesenterica]|uniref:Uncharacterized protein n=1 Tax=Tremella mesenterica TaxID=5217 RepID=A0A4Q1BJ32_TREME|nr:hypothetical protein M231_05090 [Tremella mesenterica]